MANKPIVIRFDETTLDRLYEVLIARAHAQGMEPAHMTYAPWRNGLTKSQVIRDLIDEEWTRLQDSGQMTRAKVSKCPNCGRTDCGRGMFCEG
jgi:hypothetical protein